MSTDRRCRRLVLMLAIAATVVLVLGGCANTERQGIRVVRTATVDPGVRVLLDNCPGPELLTLSVSDEVLWSVEAPEDEADAEDDAESPSTTSAPDDGAPDGSATEDTGTEDGATEGTAADRPPAVFEVRVGEAPDGWTTVQDLEQPLRDDIRYTIATEPDGQSIQFAIPNLSTRSVFDGVTSSPFSTETLDEPCEEPADVGKFFRDMAVLGALGLTSAALVLVALITVLFVITRRFSRIRTIERRLAEAEAATQAAVGADDLEPSEPG